jgi:uncharacterized protein YndB with AHSA1/START domain
VSAFAEIDIAAPRREVWGILADVASWPTWNPAIRQSVRDEDLEVGSRFRFSTEIGTLKCRVTAVDSPRSLSWKGRVLVLGERQTWHLETTDIGTHVTVYAEMTGLASRLLRRRLTQRLQAVVDSVLQLLRLEAEVRMTEAVGEASVAHGDKEEGGPA